MPAQERLREAIDQRRSDLQAGVPADREAAIQAVLAAVDQQPILPVTGEPVPDLITGYQQPGPGGNLALQLCLEAGSNRKPTTGALTDLVPWANGFLIDCEHLARAELVLAHCETGYLQLVEDGGGRFDAWVTTKRVPARVVERMDIHWWQSWLASQHAPALNALPARLHALPGADRIHLVDALMATMAHQISYPPDAVIGGCSIATYREVLAALIARVPGERKVDSSTVLEVALIADVASATGIDPSTVRHAITAFTLDRENAAYHAAVPGIAAAPVVRLANDQVALSLHGLTTEPLLFLARELRRRYPEEYHNAAALREAVFREDLYTLFRDKRFVTSGKRIELRDRNREIRTDIDAAVFDRKTGTLGLFELKSQDPFARSTAELERQQENLLHANRQVSGILSWLNRHGPDEILNRFDSRTAKSFRVQKVHPFVLGRYLAQVDGGHQPDRRVAWASWPQVLRATTGQPVAANPITALFNRVTKEAITQQAAPIAAAQNIQLGSTWLIVHPSYAAYRSDTAHQ